jgi:hypothetical protein
MNKEVSHYVVTAHPPGSVLVTAKCNFLSPHSKVSKVIYKYFELDLTSEM